MAMKIGNDGKIHTPAGKVVESVEQAIYLGGLLYKTASAKPEVSLRLGEARSSCKALV